MRFRSLTSLVALLAVAACSDKELVVESNTTWSGVIVGLGGVQGEGNATIDLSNAPSDVCWTLKKETSAGTLRAYLRDKTWFGLGTEIDGDQTTTAPGGQIGGCNE